jgi:hypothetical protein
MRRDVLSWSVLFAVLAGITACGDNKHKPDAPPSIDAPPPDAANACDYTEQHDATNDYNLPTGFVAEQTGIAFSGTPKTICGVVNNGHYSAANGSIDIDDYRFTVTADADVIVSLTGDLQAITTIGIFAADSAQKGVGGGYFINDHGVFSTHLPAGSYEISAEAYANGDIAAPVPYKIKIAPDMPATRCPKVTAAANYTEAKDMTPLFNQNDTVDIDFTKTPFAQATNPATTPEPTGVTVAAGTNYRLSGTSSLVTGNGSYFDMDAYLITTGASTNQLAVRLNWPDATADLDLYVFQAGRPNPPISSSAHIKNGEDEFVTLAVAGGSQYWLWVGAATMPGAGGYAYDLSVCGETFTP